MSRSLVVLVATASAGFMLSACGGAPSPAVTVTEAAPTVAAPTVTMSETPLPTTTPAETEAAAEPTPASETFTMPKLVGKNLQLAQDTLQKEGSYLLDQQDAAGLDRVQINDSNWKVCSQKPKAGATVPIEVMVVLASVKLDENCP